MADQFSCVVRIERNGLGFVCKVRCKARHFTIANTTPIFEDKARSSRNSWPWHLSFSYMGTSGNNAIQNLLQPGAQGDYIVQLHTTTPHKSAERLSAKPLMHWSPKTCQQQSVQHHLGTYISTAFPTAVHRVHHESIAAARIASTTKKRSLTEKAATDTHENTYQNPSSPPQEHPMCHRTTIHYSGCGHPNETPVVECSQASMYPFSICEAIVEQSYTAEERDNRICRAYLADLGRAVLEMMEKIESAEEREEQSSSQA